MTTSRSFSVVCDSPSTVSARLFDVARLRVRLDCCQELKMKLIAVVALAVLTSMLTEARAQQAPPLSVGRLFSNDFLGDGHDRWRSGSYSLSLFTGTNDSSRLLPIPGDLLEYRVRSEIIAPSSLAVAGAEDRPYAGILSFGVHTHFRGSGFEYSVGLDLVAVGPQTRLFSFQQDVHDVLGFDPIDPEIQQLSNDIFPTITLEMAHSIEITESVLMRPFFEIQAGVERYVRAGLDMAIGNLGRNHIRSRDVTTGHRYRSGTGSAQTGLIFVAGADIARVFASKYLTEELGYDFNRERARARLGVEYQGKSTTLFYGLTWLGKEFRGQTDSQVVGSLQANIRF